MTQCQIELMNAGKPYPRTCQLCGLGGACVKGLERGIPDRNPTHGPVFDANGWCHDMNAAPRDGTQFQAWLTDGLSGRSILQHWEPLCRFNDEGVFEIWGRVDFDMDGWKSDWNPEWVPTAWRPLPAPPVKEQDQ